VISTAWIRPLRVEAAISDVRVLIRSRNVRLPLNVVALSPNRRKLTVTNIENQNEARRTLMASPPTREAAVIVLDVSAQTPPADFALGREVASLVVQRKMLLGGQDLVGLVFSGTANPLNRLNAASPGAYANIAVQKPLVKADLDLVRTIEAASQEAGGCDVLDSIVAACDLLHECVADRRYNRVVYFITAAAGAVREKKALLQIVDALVRRRITLVIVGLGFDPRLCSDVGADADADDGAGGDAAAAAARAAAAADDDADPASWSNLTVKQQNEKALHFLCAQVLAREDEDAGAAKARTGEDLDAVIYSARDAEAMMQSLRKRVVPQRPSCRLVLRITRGLAVAGWVYLQTSPQPAPRFARVGPKGEPLTTTRRFFSVAKPDRELREGQRWKAMQYGRSTVSLAEYDSAGAMRFRSKKGLTLLCFVRRQDVPPHLFMGHVRVFAPAPTDAVAARVLGALCRAMEQRGRVMLVRFVWRDDSAPVICAAFADTGLAPDGVTVERAPSLRLLPLPFAEDMRDLQFPALDGVRVADEELDAVRAMVDAMTPAATGATASAADRAADFYRPEVVFNPALQLHMHMLREKFMHGCVLPDFVVSPPPPPSQQQQGGGDDQRDDDGADGGFCDVDAQSELPAPQLPPAPRHDLATMLQPRAWELPPAIRRRCCAWGREGNVLHGLFERSTQARQRVRALFPSVVDMVSPALTLNKRSAAAAAAAGGAAGGATGGAADFWYQRQGVPLKMRRAEDDGPAAADGTAGGSGRDSHDGFLAPFAPDAPRSASPSKAPSVSGGGSAYDALGRRARVSTVDPAGTFRALAAAPDAAIEALIDELGAVIEHLLRVAVGGEYEQRCLDALRAMREVCVREEEPNAFNRWLNATRLYGCAADDADDLWGAGGAALSATRRAPQPQTFFECFVKTLQIAPITREECPESALATADLAAFLAPAAPAALLDENRDDNADERDDDWIAEME
jgi:hypothetical protein